MKTTVSIVIPALDEADCVAQTLAELQRARREGHQVVLVDGGSADGTPEIAGPEVDLLVIGDRGRATQMNAGARQAGGDVLLFLHADTLLTWESLQRMLQQFRGSDRSWGRFDVRLSGDRCMLRVIAWLINRRTRLTGIATGDQAIFVRREAFEAVGGFPEIALMEDIAISRRLKKLTRPLCLEEQVTTSSRRWEERGVVRTTLLMWGLRLGYAFGAAPERLARTYGRAKRRTERGPGRPRSGRTPIG